MVGLVSIDTMLALAHALLEGSVDLRQLLFLLLDID